MVFRSTSRALVLFLAVAWGAFAAEDTAVMSAGDALAMPRPEPDHRLSYGDGPLQFGELRLPGGNGPHPVVVVIHGGCWLAEYDLGYMSAFSDALTDAGFATWSIEYRRVGDEGGGWPGTFQDVADGADHVTEIASQFNLDLNRVAAVGHSAGGHLALWLAGRKSLGADDPLSGTEPLHLDGVVGLAGIPDLAAYAAPEGCGAAVPGLLGGDPSVVKDRVLRSSPIEMADFGIPLVLVIGGHDVIVPASQARSFASRARRNGESVRVVEIAEAGHFELVSPTDPAFSTVRELVVEAVGPPARE